MYALNQAIISAFPACFAGASIVKEREFKTFAEARSYFFIRFESAIKVPVTQESIGPIIDLLLAGDKSLSKLYETYSAEVNQNSASLRWVGNEEDQTIDIDGLVLNVIVPRQGVPCLDYHKIIEPLIAFQLIDDAIGFNLRQQLKQAFALPPVQIPTLPRLFFANEISKQYRKLTELGRAAIIESQISTIKKESTDRVYAGEHGINPAYENLSQVNYQLHPNEKRIWLLRGDFNLTIGVKNAYQGWGYHAFHDNFDEQNYAYLDWNNRTGHPSLARVAPEIHYDGDVYYAGHLAQRNGYLEVVDNSGRFDRPDLTVEQLVLLEAYIALQFQKAFGQQKIVFAPHPRRNTYDADYFELSAFYRDHDISKKSVVKREYDADAIAKILSGAEKDEVLSFSKTQ